MVQSIGVIISSALVLLAVVTFEVHGASRPYEDRFTDFGIYRIRNKAIVGVLNFNQTNANATKVFPKTIPTTEELDDSNPAQKWRLETKMLTVAFELRPLLDDRYVLEYWNDDNILRWIASWGWGDNKMWYLQDAGDGYTQIRNKQNDVCLESQGIGREIIARKCTGTAFQSWEFVSSSAGPASVVNPTTTVKTV